MSERSSGIGYNGWGLWLVGMCVAHVFVPRRKRMAAGDPAPSTPSITPLATPLVSVSWPR
ncbi:hypothetical protein [Perlabentimonas gracilis]|uniref:hypothetical protein n=1 Tax=Perlabentimonas gracilis TaxID=2715279 RepID=UPI001408C8B4|nr:hypothetical protein [Perlabentimonas gracilis]